MPEIAGSRVAETGGGYGLFFPLSALVMAAANSNWLSMIVSQTLNMSEKSVHIACSASSRLPAFAALLPASTHCAALVLNFIIMVVLLE